MLKRFFFNALSSFVGAWIALALFGVVVVIAIVGILSRLGAGDMAPGLKSDSILKLELSGVIEEAEKARDFDPKQFLLEGGIERPSTLNTLVMGIREAKHDKNIKMMFIDCHGVAASPATLHALRQAVADFRESGKKVFAYGDALSQGDYYVASVADSIFLNPRGMLELQGLATQSLYMKDLFDKLGVRFTVCKVGTFKSAVEPFISQEMSVPARAQLDTLQANMWSYLKEGITESRRLGAGALDSLMRTGIVALHKPEGLVESGMVDRLVYRRQMLGILARETGRNADDLRMAVPGDLVAQTDWEAAYGSKRQVAVLYATGEIAEGYSSGIDCETMVPEIVRLAEDDNVKALVLRVNSPGGSVFGSEQIAEALAYFKSKGKPFCVSMGDMAASGGYWISADADRIFADPLTITGSIGIFGLFPDVSGLLAKIGVSPQTVETNPQSRMPGLMTPVTEHQRSELQKFIDQGYEDFINRVAKGRHMKPSRVRTIAEGRVWDGKKAMEIGLVDELGSLDDAIVWAANEASLMDAYDVAAYPRYESGIMDLFSLGAQLGLGSDFDSDLSALEPNRELLRKGMQVIARKPVQALAPEITIRL